MKVEIRENSITLDGYVNVVARESRELPSPRGFFREIIMPKTFEKALAATDNVDLLFNHDKARKLGSLQSGNLKLYEDNVGLRAIATVSDKEVIEKARKNELQGWSFGFVAKSDSWKNEGYIQKRYVDSLELLEVSILDCLPAYIATSIEMRDSAQIMLEYRNAEPVHFIKNPEDELRSKIITQIKTALGDSYESEMTLHEKRQSIIKRINQILKK